jgi:hypothetical protein
MNWMVLTHRRHVRKHRISGAEFFICFTILRDADRIARDTSLLACDFISSFRRTKIPTHHAFMDGIRDGHFTEFLQYLAWCCA